MRVFARAQLKTLSSLLKHLVPDKCPIPDKCPVPDKRPVLNNQHRKPVITPSRYNGPDMTPPNYNT